MHYAAKNSPNPVIELLLKNRANPEALDCNNQTPAMLVDGQNANDSLELIQQYSDKSKHQIKNKNSNLPSVRG